jgi:hypothetical protein
MVFIGSSLFGGLWIELTWPGSFGQIQLARFPLAGFCWRNGHTRQYDKSTLFCKPARAFGYYFSSKVLLKRA